MGLSNYTVRCIKMLSPQAIEDTVSGIIAASYTDIEEADLLLISANAMAWGF